MRSVGRDTVALRLAKPDTPGDSAASYARDTVCDSEDARAQDWLASIDALGCELLQETLCHPSDNRTTTTVRLRSGASSPSANLGHLPLNEVLEIRQLLLHTGGNRRSAWTGICVLAVHGIRVSV